MHTDTHTHTWATLACSYRRRKRLPASLVSAADVGRGVLDLEAMRVGEKVHSRSPSAAFRRRFS
jgi:hypothetical protein